MHVISMTWKSHVSGMRDDLHPSLPFATPVATIRTTPTFVKHSAKALRNKYSPSLLLSPLLLLRRHVHPVLPTWRATNQTDKRLWPWSEPPLPRQPPDIKNKKKGKTRSNSKLKSTHTHSHTLLTVWVHVPFALRGHNCSGKLCDAFLFGTQNP